MILTPSEAKSVKVQLSATGTAHLYMEVFYHEARAGIQVGEMCEKVAVPLGYTTAVTHCVGYEHMPDGTHITIKVWAMGQNGTDG